MHDIEGRHARSGSIEVIVGSMFSGKTEELLRLLRRAQFARQSYQIFKPRIDTRYSKDHVASHDKTLMAAVVINKAAEIYQHLKPDTRVVGIDEGQFFDEELVDVCNDLAGRGLRVLIAGLDMNWKGEPFRPMPELMAVAENVKKLQAVCVVCGAPAARTQRLVASKREILVGDHQTYEPRCRACFDLSLAQPDEETQSSINTLVAVFDQDELLTIEIEEGPKLQVPQQLKAEATCELSAE